MKRVLARLFVTVMATAFVSVGFPQEAQGQFGKLKQLGKAIQNKVVKSNDDNKEDKEQDENKSDTAGTKSPIVFSRNPLDPSRPKNLTNSFKAGDHIYGLIQVETPWAKLLGKKHDGKIQAAVPVDMIIDGKTVGFQYITIVKPEALETKVLVLDIAPEPSKMTAYKDPGFIHAEGKGNRKIGPDAYTYELADLKSGKHTIRFQVRSYGDVFSAGEFTIDGSDYKAYAELREKILAEAQQTATMPEAQKIDKRLEATMLKLLENAGWKNIRKLVIADKDWWLDRVDGGDTAIKSRHIAAAVAAKGEDGKFFWCKATFHEQKNLDGSFGPLELTHVGDKKPILEKNIDGAAAARDSIGEGNAKLDSPPAEKEAPASAEKKSPKKAGAGGGDPKQINSEIERKFRDARNASTAEIVALAEEIEGLIEELRAADPNHRRLASHEKKVKKIVADAYAKDVKEANNQIERYVARIDMYLERNKEEERENLQTQRKGLGETLKQYRAALESAGPEGRKVIKTTEAKIRQVDERIGVVLAGDNLAEQWNVRLRQFTRDGDKDLTRDMNNDTDEAKLRQDRAEADKVWAEYQKAAFPNGKTSELKQAEEFLKQAMAEVDRKFKFAEEGRQKEAGQKEKESAGTAGKIVFSAKPIDPAKPADLAAAFKAPDHLYSLIQIDKKWADLLGKTSGGETTVEVPIEMMVDGKTAVFQYIKIKKADAQNSKVLLLDIAPDPARMVAYKDPGFQYGEAKEYRKIGPDAFTHILSELGAGKHTVRIQIRSFGDYLVVGDFTLEGDDYKAYGKLREKIVAEAQKSATMPEALKIDKALEDNMRKLLVNAGWKNIRKLVIVDKDWWLDRVNGGDTAVTSRHMAAAAAAKGEDGKFYWCTVTFHQQKLITGAFGPLELTHTGRKKPIEEKNIDK